MSFFLGKDDRTTTEHQLTQKPVVIGLIGPIASSTIELAIGITLVQSDSLRNPSSAYSLNIPLL